MADEYIPMQPYDPTQWSAGKSITADLMNKIELGIRDAISWSNTAGANAHDALATTEDFSSRLLSAESAISNLEDVDGRANARIKQGEAAWSQIADLISWTRDESGNYIVTKSLFSRIAGDGGIEQKLDSIQTNVNGAKRDKDDSLGARFETIDGLLAGYQQDIQTLYGNITTINTTFADAVSGTQYTTIQQRFGANETNIATMQRVLKAALADRNYTGDNALDNRFLDIENILTALKSSMAYSQNGFDERVFSSIDDRLETTEAEIVAAKTSSIYGQTNTPVTYSTLNQRFEATETEIKTARGGLANLNERFNRKMGYSDIEDNLLFEGTSQTKALDARQGKILDDKIAAVGRNYQSADSSLSARLDTLETNVNGAKVENGAQTLDARFDAIDGGSAPSRTLPQVISEVNSSHTSTVIKTADNQNSTYTNLGERLEAMETYAKNIKTVIDNAKSSHANAVNNEDQVYSSLDARLEADEESINTVAAQLGSGLSNTNDGITGTATAQLSALRDRATALEENVNGAKVENGPQTLDARFDAVEGRATQLETDINTIAQELAMVDTDTIVSNNTRVDQLENDLRSMAAELNMLDGTAIVDTNTRVDTLEGRINAIDNNTDGRMKVAEGAIDTLEDQIGSGFDSNNTVAQAIADAIDTANDYTDDGLALKADSSYVDNQLALKANSADMTTALAGKADNTTVNNISTTIVKGKAQVTYIEGVPSNTQTWTIEDKNDYLLQNDDDKYYYWKHIDNEWHLMGGAGSGTGTSSAEILEVLPSASNADVNTDYYIGTQANGYLHYRFIDVDGTLTPVLIGVNPENVKTYNIDIGTETVNIEGADTDVNYLYFYEFDYGEDNTDTEHKTPTKIRLPSMGGGGGVISTQKLQRITERYLTHVYNSDSKVELKFFYTSGEKGAGARYTLTSGTTTLLSDIQINSGDPEDLSNTWPTKEVEVDGETVTVPLSETEAAAKGFYSIDITEWCNAVTVGKTFKLVVYDVDDPSLNKPLSWEVAVINLTASTTLEVSSINNLGTNLSVPYTITGNIAKTAHFKLDDTEIATVELRQNQSNNGPITVPAQSAGAHRLEIYATATVNGSPLQSNIVKRDLIWYDSSATDIIISSPYRYRNSQDIVNVKQYEVLSIPYTIIGGSGNYAVEYYVDNLDSYVQHVVLTNTNSGTWNYRANLQEAHTLYIKSGSSVIEIHINVEQLDIDIAQVTDNLIIDFNPAGITNSSSLRNWTNGTYSMTVSDNFDWFSGGYGSDIHGDYFLVKAGTRATFDYKMFTNYISSADGVTTTNSTVFRDGAEMKVIFKTSAVRDADAVWLTNMGPANESAAAKSVGIQLNAHNGWLMTDAAAIDNTKSYLYFPYSEEDRIELDININPKTAKNAVYAMSYEDGCPSRAYPYDPAEALYQVTGEESNIVIGSDDCDVYIYRLRIYNAALSTEQVLRNFIADGKDVNESIDRYNRNCIYYNTQTGEYTPYEGPDIVLDPERLAQKVPDVKILMLDAPRFTTSKKDFVAQSTLRCIHAEGGKIYPSRGKEDNWFFGNGYHAGQGTTSDKYGDAGRNLDFLFECDGIHNPSDKVKPDAGFIPGYQSYVIKGYGLYDNQGNSLAEEPQYCLDWKDEDTWKPNTPYSVDALVRANGQVYKCLNAHTSGETFNDANWDLLAGYSSKISLTSTSIPNNFFNLKVNIASSENVNNALFQKRYNDFLPYTSPAYLRDNRIKNDMEFVPAIIFVRENDTAFTEENVNGQVVRTYTNHNEFNDTNWHFYGLGNLGDSKKTDYTRAYDPTDMNEFTLEISDNNTNNSQFQSGVYMKNGVRTIQPYHVEEDEDDKGKKLGTYTAYSDEHDIAVETTDYLFPIDRATEWEAVDENDEPLNMRYWSLFNEDFDGDHSFEMRYACKGDYRDGKVVNDTTGHAKAQLKLNEKVWRSFYTWLVTATDQQFIDELDQWCVRSAVSFFYAFTHYYTMIDNRAKNTFWHFAKTGKHRIVSRPEKDMLHTYEEAVGAVTPNALTAGVWDGTFVPTTDTEIQQYVLDPQSGEPMLDENEQPIPKVYYTQYAFDMWVYDCDTAAGIDNNGELIFPYGKEDTDYRVDGDISSGPVYNGAGSIFWARLRQNCNENIVNAFTGVPAECFNAENLIAEFDQYQNCYPESVWRLDVERKYIRPFTGDDGATEEEPNQPIFLTRQNARFLGDMMQGRKKYQRRQWVKDQGVYFGSKYMLQNISGNQIDMVCYNIGGQQVLPNWDLTITPYQDMYLNVDYGETAIRGKRAKKNVPVEIKCPFDSMNESRLRIYGGDYIRTLAGKPIKNENQEIIGAESLASLYFRGNDFSHMHKMRELYIGSSNATYTNSQFTKLNINSNNPILEVLDLQNCDGLVGTLTLNESTALKRLELQGTQYSQVVLPGSTGIEVLHLPNTITKIALNAAKKLNELTVKTRADVTDLSSITTLQINDSDYSANIDWMQLATQALPHIVDLQLLNLNLAHINDIIELQAFADKKTELGDTTDSEGNIISRINLSGILHVTGTYSTVEQQAYGGTPTSIWPNLNIDVSAGSLQVKHKVTYKYDSYINDDGNVVQGDTIKVMYINHGDAIPDIWQYIDENDQVVHILDEMPSRESTVRHNYQFGLREYSNYVTLSGWKYAGSNTPLSAGLPPYASNDNIVIETYFTVTPRTYPVKWYLYRNRPDSQSLIKTSDNEVDYGGGYELVAPTVEEIHNAGFQTATVSLNGGTATYSIFDGWEKLPTNINPTKNDTSYNIYASWHTGSIALIDLYTENDNLSDEERLLVLSALDEQTKTNYSINNKVAISSRVNFTMGHDYDNENAVTLVSTNSVLRTDLSSYNGTRTDVQPFREGNNAFTLVLDYSFKKDVEYDSSKNSAILASCYYQNNSSNALTGFALYYNLNTNSGAEVGPRVGFGDMFNQGDVQSVPVGSTTNLDARNIVVLRHKQDDDVLYIYSGLTGDTSMPANVTVRQLTWNNLSNDAYLNFGRLTNSTESDYASIKLTTEKAQGTIYWAKYWPEDLGAGECMQLASWPHEKITYAISVLASGKTTDNRITNVVPSIYLTTLEASAHGQVVTLSGNQASETRGWGTANLREICNTRIMQGLPTRLQSIICKPQVVYRTASPTTGIGGMTQYKLDANSSISYDYVFVNSIANISNNADYQIEEGSSPVTMARPFAWLSDANSIKLYTYTTGNTWTESSDSSKLLYYNLRFPYQPIQWSSASPLRIFRVTSSTVLPSNVSAKTAIGYISGGIKVGDIFIPSGNTTAYIYVSDDDITKYGAQVKANTGEFACDTGGWVEASTYWTRSMGTGTWNSTFYCINSTGNIAAGTAGSGNSLNYSISI